MKASISLFWNRLMFVTILIELAALLLYMMMAFYFFNTKNDLFHCLSFNQYRDNLLSILVYLIEMNAFFMGLWAYLWLLEIDRNGFKHQVNPANTFISFIIPVINLFAPGLMFSKIINKADNKWYADTFEPISKALKNGLIMFYAGMMGVIFSYGLSATLPYNDDTMSTTSFQLFQFLFIALIVLALSGLLKLLKNSRRFAAASMLIEPS